MKAEDAIKKAKEIYAGLGSAQEALAIISIAGLLMAEKKKKA